MITKKKEKEKYQVEFELRSSPKILYNFISNASGLEEWFAENVVERDGIFSFKWEGSAAKAKLLSKKDNHSIRMHWLEEKDDSYFEMEIVQDDITGDIALLITDFAPKSEQDAGKRLWEAQVQTLRQILGS
jgi:hypothetical protein